MASGETKCEICGVETVDDMWAGEDYDFADMFLGADSFQVEISRHFRMRARREKHEYARWNGDYGLSESFEVEFCPSCWKEHLVPFLEKLGVNVNVKVSEW